jgi:hypothetical protein
MTRPTTTPGVDARAWQRLSSDPNLTATQRACLSAAYAHADLVVHLLGRDAGAARDGLWYTLAVGFYHHLNGSGAFRHLPATQLPARAVADADRIRRWLTSPSRLPQLTMAEGLGVTADFDWQDPDLATLIPALVAEAQRAGRLSVPGHEVQVRALAPDEDGITEYLILLRGPTGTLASAPTAADHLADDALIGVDAAVSVITNTAYTVTELLANLRDLAYGPHSAALVEGQAPRRGFTSLATAPQAPPTTALPSGTTSQPRPRGR